MPARSTAASPPRAVLGAKTETAGADLKLAQVFDGGPAQSAGLSAGDILVAIDGVRVTGANLEQRLARQRPGDAVRISAFRRDELIERTLRLQPAPLDTYALSIDERAPAARKRRLASWLRPA